MKNLPTLTGLFTLSLALLNAQETQSIQQESKKQDEKVLLETAVVSAPIMRFSLDELNRNMVIIDKEAINDKGYKNLEDVFRTLPFVNLTDVGLGKNIDLRGQGDKANTSVQVLVNGIPQNMLDSSHGVTPLNTIDINSIERIEILPGGGAVMYGNGTRGGVVNIITQRRYEKPTFNANIGYSNVLEGNGNSYNVDFKYGNKTNENLYYSFGANYQNKGGPRYGDKIEGVGANLSLTKDIGQSQSVFFDFDIFRGDIDSSPNNSFLDNPNPSKNDRKTPGNGDFHNRQLRFDASLGYQNELSPTANLIAKIFYHYNKIDYLDNITYVTNYSGFPIAQADQSGSFFDDQKIGLDIKYDQKHNNGLLILGAQSTYNMSKRTMDNYISADNPTAPFLQGYRYDLYIPFEGNKWSNSLYALEKYDFTDRFSLMGGIRYEYDKYDINVSHNTIKHALITPMGEMDIGSGRIVQGSLNEDSHNFAFEINPNYKYSTYGNIYAKYERGFISPSPNSLLQRQGTTYQTTNIKDETYNTFEIGIRDFWWDTFLFSLTGYYTLTNDEFYTIGTAHSISGVEYGNYDKTERMGFELFLEQYFLDNTLTLTESLSYTDAKIKKQNGQSTSQRIPYVSKYKATLGLNYKFLKDYTLWINNTFYGNQVDTIQSKIQSYSLTDIGITAKYKEFLISAGVKNLFDKFYYSFYNSDSSDVITGYSYLIGQGRTFFISAKYSF
ncbi:TonB-dependent receptor [Helicobacter pullorum]